MLCWFVRLRARVRVCARVCSDAKSDPRPAGGGGSVSVTEAALATESAAALADYDRWLQQHGAASAVQFAPACTRFSNGDRQREQSEQMLIGVASFIFQALRCA